MNGIIDKGATTSVTTQSNISMAQLNMGGTCASQSNHYLSVHDAIVNESTEDDVRVHVHGLVHHLCSEVDFLKGRKRKRGGGLGSTW